MKKRFFGKQVFLFVTLGALNVFATTYVVDAPGKLTTIAAQIQAAPAGGTDTVQFKTYVNVGTFSLTSLNADSLIFQRAEESAEVIEFTGTLFQLQSVTAAVVFKNLAFKAKDGSSKFIQGSTVGNENRNLLIDSCQIFGDSLNTTFLSWGSLAGVGSKVILQRSMIVGLHGVNPKIDLISDTSKILNCYFNFPGQILNTLTKRIDVSNVSTNRVQFRLTGDGTTLYNFKNNIFGSPPVTTKLPGNSNKFIMYLIGFAGGTAIGDSRFSTWYNFEFPANEGHADPSNQTIAPFGDSLDYWNFYQSSESINGYLNPSSSKFPSYNIFPGDSTLKTSLSSKDSVELILSTAQIPRVISASYGTITYPASLDSTRSFWLKDTILQVTGPTTIKKITLPLAKAQGKPILFSESTVSYLAGTMGTEGTLNFLNAQPSSKKFIPSFAGQNTSRGSNISVTGITADTSFIFTTISRSGRTGFQTPILDAAKKRIRLLTQAGKPFGFRDTTTAEGSDSIRFSFTKTGVDAPFRKDSLSWSSPDGVHATVTDSAGKFWGKTVFSSTSQALLIERLGIGAGKDTVTLSRRRVLTTSTKGHQISIDTTFAPTLALYPDMGSFSKGTSLKWPGRAVGDSLFFELQKTSSQQKAYFKDSSKAILVIPLQEDSTKITLALSLEDSNKTFFLARKYSIPAGGPTKLKFNESDSVLDLMSYKPGELYVDSTTIISKPLDLTTSRVLGYRNIRYDSLDIQGNYTIKFTVKAPLNRDSIHVMLFDGVNWKSLTTKDTLNRYSLTIDKTISGITIFETLQKQQLIIKQPITIPTATVVGSNLNITPVLTPEEKTIIKTYHIELFTIDLNGNATVDTSKDYAIDTPVIIPVNDKKLSAYRIIYKSQADKTTSDSIWIPLLQNKLNSAEVQAAITNHKSKNRYLIGLPFDGNYKDNIEAGFDPVSTTNKLELHQLQNDQWVSVAVESNPILSRGVGYLVGATTPFQIKIGKSAVPSIVADTLKLTGVGWHIITNPFPFPIADANIKLDTGAVSLFLSLQKKDTAAFNSSYSWNRADTLKPFEGYLVYCSKNTQIIFDPIRLLLKSALKKTNNNLNSSSLQLIVSGKTESASATLFTGNQYRTTPYFKPIGDGLDLRLLDNGSFTYKSLKQLDSIETDLEIISTRVEAANLSVHFEKSLTAINGTAENFDIRLLDNQSGKVYTKPDLASVDLVEGKNSFKLLVGTSNSLDRKLEKIQSNMPQVLTLEQNFPNPFYKGETQIRFQIPGNIGKVVKGRMDVIDLTGKIIESISLESPTIGTHLLKLGQKNWKPGIYIAQLSIVTPTHSYQLRKKMINGAESK